LTFRIIFESDVGSYDARLSRHQAISWLKSRRMEGTVPSPTSVEMTSLEELDNDGLANVLAAAALDMVGEVAAKGGLLNVRNLPDDEPRSFVSILATSIHAVRVVPSTDDDDYQVADELGLPFRASDRREISEMLRRLDEPASE
jgi:hypothetical protein